MARKARVKSKTGIYAVILRGFDKIFATKKMKEAFYDATQKYIGKGLLGIKFSQGNVEMLIKESEKGISMDIKPLITSFARTYNRETGNEGKVFMDRFKSVPIEDSETQNRFEAYLNGKHRTNPLISETVHRSKRSEKRTIGSVDAKQYKHPEAIHRSDAEGTIKKDPEMVPKTEIEKPIKRRNDTMPTWLL